MRQKVNINNNSISNTVTGDYKKAICEFIWNGFDANAVKVEINYTANELGTISSLSVTDNGDGIDRSLLDETFGCYQDSIKRKVNVEKVDSLSIALLTKQSGFLYIKKRIVEN